MLDSEGNICIESVTEDANVTSLGTCLLLDIINRCLVRLTEVPRLLAGCGGDRGSDSTAVGDKAVLRGTTVIGVS